MISSLLAQGADSAVSVAWIGLIGVTVTAVAGPIIVAQLKKLIDRNDRQHAEAAVARRAYAEERHAEFDEVVARLDRIERVADAATSAAAASTQALNTHTEEELQRYAAITLLLVQLVGQRSVDRAEDAAGLEPSTATNTATEEA